MIKKTKGIICLICVFMLLATSIVPAIADGKSLAFDMEAMGITAGMDASARGEEYVRRDEFAQMVVNMMQQIDVAKTLENEASFTDIADSKYKGAINLLAKMNYISGNGNGVYNPSEYITYGAACKILVHALGYDVITEDKSLYGYQYTAGSIKLTDGIDSSKQYLSFEQAMKMLDNALDIGLMVPMYYNANIAPSYEIDADRTYRNLIEGRTIGTGVVKKTGIITADVSTYLYDETVNLKPSQLEIDGKVYNFDGTAPKGYVGQMVDFYVTYNNFEEGHITAVAPTNENTVCDFSGNAIDSILENEICFYTSEGYKYKVQIDYTTRFIVNNRFVPGYDVSKELKADENVIVRAIDNNADELTDVVFVFDYTDCIIKSVSADTLTLTFEDGFKYGTLKNLKLDENKMNWEIYDEKGKEISFESIQTDDVLSIAISNDNEAVRIVKSDKTVEGVVAERDGKYIVIDGTEYVLGETIIDEVNSIAKVMVIQEVMLSDAGMPVLDTSDIGLVISVSDVLSEDKATEYKAIKMLTNGGEYKYIVADARVSQSEIAKLQKNDLIQYTLDGFDRINTVKVLQKNDEYYESFVDDYYYGEVKNIEHNKISNSRARRINEVSMGYSNSDTVEGTVDLLIKNPSPVYIIEGKEARIATLDDIQFGDMMYVSLYNTTEVRAVVIKR